MGGDPQRPDRRSARPRQSDVIVGLFVTVLWAAVVFAIDGLLSVGLDRDPIGGAVSPYYGILSLALAAILVWLVLIGTIRSQTPWFGALAAMAGVYLVLVASALPIGLVLAGQQAGSPFVVAAALVAGAAVVATWVVVRQWHPKQ